MQHDSTTIDLGRTTDTVPAHYDLAGRLAQLADIAERGDFADDHVINVLLARYRAHSATTMTAMSDHARDAG